MSVIVIGILAIVVIVTMAAFYLDYFGHGLGLTLPATPLPTGTSLQETPPDSTSSAFVTPGLVTLRITDIPIATIRMEITPEITKSETPSINPNRFEVEKRLAGSNQSYLVHMVGQGETLETLAENTIRR